jgi:hypothetical protein
VINVRENHRLTKDKPKFRFFLSRKERKVNNAEIAEFSWRALRNISLRSLREYEF